MNFQSIKPVEDYKFYLDLAFRRARERGKLLRATKLKGGRVDKSKYIELLKMQVIADTISSRMEGIIKSFPNLDELPQFYNELLRISLDYAQLKKSLGAANWLRLKSRELMRIYNSKLDKNTLFERINPLRTEFLGRLSSMVKQIRHDLQFLEEARRIIKEFPVIKTSLKTAAIAGFPNAGKTTLLSKLTGSIPEINSYPFTTKGVNVAYIGTGKDRIQLLDVPGTLNRFEKMNNIEKIAYLAIKHCADIIVYIFDLTGEYPLEKQIKLYEKLKNESGKEILIYLSKSDIVDSKEIQKFGALYNDSIADLAELKEKIQNLKR